ncbi:MAG: short-chain fatty acyl-CoA regulator family protein [Gammaproteobacteria bacterium]
MREKLYVGPKLRLLREHQGLTLDACAARLGLSPSYLSQLETNQRPVTARVLIALSRTFAVDPAEFDADDESRLIADLREASADLALGVPAPTLTELKLTATTTPAVARQFLALHRAYRGLDQRLKTLDEALGSGTATPSGTGTSGAAAGTSRGAVTRPEASLPYEEVRDFFHYRNNYLDELDPAAETLGEQLGLGADEPTAAILERYLREEHGITVARVTAGPEGDLLRHFDPATRVLTVDRDTSTQTLAFQFAVQAAELAFAPRFEEVLRGAGLRSREARDVARVSLANYAAGALVMPYGRFAGAARELRHDVEQLQRRFHASFEQVCHRLSTLQRPGAHGVPFYFVRVDQAGNITKRHSATRFQFARFGGACPLWNVHEAFGHPGRILVQVAQMPDGVRYLCIGRSIVKRSGSYLRPNRQYAVGLGCEVTHAHEVVYADGVALDGRADQIGISCRTCEREHCHQRAFPPLDRKLVVPAHERRLVPFALG